MGTVNFAGGRNAASGRGAAIGRIVVVIPAHDERDRIAACVDSVIASAQFTGLPVTVRVILDACTDDTAAKVPAGGGEVGVVKRIVDHRNVGAARAAGVDPLVHLGGV